jgi:hypothetical protein
MWFLVALFVSCQRSAKVCPDGMSVWKGRTGPGQSLWCKSSDGHASAWIELHTPTDRRMICEYRQSVPEGPFRAFHRGGMHWIEGGYAHGLKEGHWRQWDKTGSLVAEGEYRDGRLIAGAPIGMAARCETIEP